MSDFDLSLDIFDNYEPLVTGSDGFQEQYNPTDEFVPFDDAKMSYTNFNSNVVAQLAVANNWWRLNTVTRVSMILDAVDFSVVESRRQGLAEINKLRETRDIEIAQDIRFPEVGLFVTSYDSHIARTLNNISSSLAYRDMQKDQSESVRPNQGHESAKDKAVGAAYNDAHKAFVEQRYTFKSAISSQAHVYNRSKFEDNFGLTFV